MLSAEIISALISYHSGPIQALIIYFILLYFILGALPGNETNYMIYRISRSRWTKYQHLYKTEIVL